MYLANLCGRSRKLGLVPKDNIKIDRYGLEDVDDFFNDESTTSQEQQKQKQSGQKLSQLKTRVEPIKEQPFDNIARKINFNDEDEDETFNLTSTISNKKSPAINKQSPLRSPLAEQDFDYNQFDDDIPDENERTNNYSVYDDEQQQQEEEDVNVPDFNMNDTPEDSLQEEEEEEKMTKKKNIRSETKSKLKKGSSSFTKKMALGKTKRLPSSFTDDITSSSITEYNESPTELEDDNIDDEKDESFQEYSSEVPGMAKSRNRVINESNLPSPPPDNNTTGLRRSKRTRIKPLAFWRNERIIYTQDFNSDEDFDTTLARDIHNIPLQLIKEVVHIPDNNVATNIQTTTTTTKKRTTKSKKKQIKRPQTPTSDMDDQELSDEEEILSGTEWMKDEDCLQLTVKDNGVLKKRKIAYNQGGGNFKQQSEDNYKVATLFDEDRDFCAGGMLELPIDGFKPPVTVTGSTYMFNVISGMVKVTLNQDEFIVKKGCKLQIPEGNEYSLRNVGKSQAYLFFVQISKPEEVEDTW